jgi:hypothetical protein
MSEMTTSTSDRPLRPWRSSACGWLVTVAALVYGVPLFLCMPPWNDITLHDMAVRAMLRGGVHYRDVFDTNLPGIDWLMALVRVTLGWSYEALRAVDLAVIAAEVVVLMGWLLRTGVNGGTVAWLAASAALFYPFTSEFTHVQRDPWLLLPALAAARMRLGRITRSVRVETREQGQAPSTKQNPSGFGRSVLEGVLWGGGVWIKPHVVIPALAVWVTSVAIISRRETRGAILLDFLALLAGGLIAGSMGVAWLVGTGAWPYYLDVFLNWNPGYLSDMWDEALTRYQYTFNCFPPWSFVHFLALPIAAISIAEVWFRPRQPVRKPWARLFYRLYETAGNENRAAARAVLAALYLGWLAQAVFLQKGFAYVQIPLILMGMTLVATQRWAFGFVALCWFFFLALVTNVPSVSGILEPAEPYLARARPEHDPLTSANLMRLWPRCWTEGASPELRDKLAWYTHIHCGTNWEDLQGVANYLKTVEPPIGPGELNCWHDSTHPLYLMFDLDPATRYMHYGTAFNIPNKREEIAAAVAASRQRYVVSDLVRMTLDPSLAYDPGAGGDPHKLPRWFPVSQRGLFPWNQPIVFRSGRYLVHKVENPLGYIDVPDWRILDELGPGEP